MLVAVLGLTLGTTACTLFGADSKGDQAPDSLIVTATPAQGTPVASADDAPTATPTATPTLNPAFPTPVLVDTLIVEQEFEHGWMFAIQDRSEIWVAAFTGERGGNWTIYQDEFFRAEEETGEELVIEFEEEPPDGMVMPVRGFGWVWANNPEVNTALGWAVWIEVHRGEESTLRYDAGGTINADGEYVPRPGRFSLDNIGGDLFVFDEATGTFTWTPATS